MAEIQLTFVPSTSKKEVARFVMEISIGKAPAVRDLMDVTAV